VRTATTHRLEARAAASRSKSESDAVFLQEQEQLKAIRESSAKREQAQDGTTKDFEGGYGGQEDLEDRYATTSGEH
jgi:hypothetical protein